MDASIKNIKENRLIILCTIMILVSFFTYGQTLKYQKVYGGYSYDYGNDLIQTTDSGYLLLSTSNSFSSSSDIYLLKIDQQGNYQWQRTYGGNEIEGACKIKFTQDGNIAMAGHTSSYLNSSYDFYLIKANLLGDIIWTKHYGTSEWDFANSMDTCADGGFILAGKTYDTGNAYSDILVVKTDADGNEQWRKKIGGNKDDVANSIISVIDGYFICGTTSSNGNGGSDIYLCKLDLNGTLIWENYYGNEYSDEGTCVYLSEDNSIVFSGNRTNPDYPNNFNTYLRKIRYSGNTYWASPNSTIGNVNYITNCVIEGFNKRVTTTGSFDMNSPGIRDLVIYLWDSTANYLQSGTHGGSQEDYGTSIIKTSDFGYAVICTTTSFGIGLSNIYFVKIDTIAPSTGALSILVDLKEPNELTAAQNIVYPNPFSNTSTIHIDFPSSLVASNAFTVKLVDQLGNEVSNQIEYSVKENNKGATITLNNIGLCNGMYFYNLILNNKNIAQGKFTIIK